MPELLAHGEHRLGVLALHEEFRRQARSPVEALDAALRRIDEVDDQLSAFYFVDADGARAQARASLERWQEGQPRSALDGVPVALKDNIATAGMPSLWGAAGTSDASPPVESCVVARLREAGAVIVGKTTMAEMGFYASSVSSRYGEARNPWDRDRTAGGSSGGAAAAVAAGMCAAAIGGDGAGSIRMPSSFCGVVGLKPSGGRVPVLPSPGVNPVCGPIARTVADAAAVLEVIAQPDERDHNAVPYPPEDYRAAGRGDVAGIRVGYLPEMGYGETPAPAIARCVRVAVDALEAEGAIVEECAPIFASDLFDEVVDAALPVIARLIEMLVAGKTDGLLPTTRQALEYARTISLDAHVTAVQRAAQAVGQFCAVARAYDVLVTPTLPRTAFETGHAFPAELAPNRFGYAFDFAAFVHIANLAAVPACSVPCGVDEGGLPIGLQVIGKRLDEQAVIRVAAACERVAADSVPTEVVA